MPSEYTCDGENVSLQLSWEDPPERTPKETKSFASSVTDQNAPRRAYPLTCLQHP
ncbi:MAG: hypothetical protein ACE5KD_03825 [Candidatus Bathyarchaeia archaeon]